LRAFYDKKRFRYLDKDLSKINWIQYCGSENIWKTASFYGDKFNIYIDTSDGVNEDLPIKEYCGRIMKVVQESKGKPFLYFKAAYSPVLSKNIIDIAIKNNGKVVPFFKWSFNENFYKYLRPNRKELIKKLNSSKKTIDAGFCSSLVDYIYPKPDINMNSVSWRDKKRFDIGLGESTGYFLVRTRKDIFEKFNYSNISFFHSKKLPYEQFINHSLSWRSCLNVPGIGEYTSRMFDHCFLGQCLVLRKTSYDFGYSWKEYLPEIDYNKKSWEIKFQKLLDDYKMWAEKSFFYFNEYWTGSTVIKYFLDEIERFNEIS